MIETEWQFLILLGAIVATWAYVNYLHRKANETSEKVFWSQRKRPLIFEQADATKATQLETIRQYQTALQKLVEHGNKYLTEADVVLWIWGADDENTEIDFARWQDHNIERRKSFIEAFYALKAQQARKANMTAEAGAMFAGRLDEFEEFKNGNNASN